jgi:uncharacterized protein
MHEPLIELAAASIRHGLVHGREGGFDANDLPHELREPRATFVTLSTPAAGLRGCRGVIEACRPLACDVWANSFASAFDDPRFQPLEASEFDRLEIEISILSHPELLRVTNEQALLRALVPHRDGVVLTWRNRRATFLPKVWEMLPDPGDFIVQLKLKAGLPTDFWADDVAVSTYRAEIVAGSARSFAESFQ